MLRLTLKKGEQVMIGDDIRLVYNKNAGGSGFSLAIEAPRDVKIERKSLLGEELITKQKLISDQRRKRQQYHASNA